MHFSLFNKFFPPPPTRECPTGSPREADPSSVPFNRNPDTTLRQLGFVDQLSSDFIFIQYIAIKLLLILTY